MRPDHDVSERRAQVARVLRRQHARIQRKLEGLRGDLAEAERAAEYRRMGEILLTYGRQVPARAAEARLPDPADPARNVVVPLDPRVTPQVNAASPATQTTCSSEPRLSRPTAMPSAALTAVPACPAP